MTPAYPFHPGSNCGIDLNTPKVAIHQSDDQKTIRVRPVGEANFCFYTLVLAEGLQEFLWKKVSFAGRFMEITPTSLRLIESGRLYVLVSGHTFAVDFVWLGTVEEAMATGVAYGGR